MQVQVKMSDRLTFIAEGATQKELFEKIAEVDKYSEIFSIGCCGICKNKNIKFQVRLAPDKKKKDKFFKFYELICPNRACFGKMSFGQLQEGDALFPKKKDAEGNYLPNNGWVKYDKDKDEDKQE